MERNQYKSSRLQRQSAKRLLPELKKCSFAMLTAPGAFLRFRDDVAVVMSLREM